MTITTVRLHQETKAHLERWRGRLIQAEGAPLSAEDTIVRLLRLADRHEADLLGQRIQMSAERIEAWLDHMNAGIRDWGVESDSSRLDDDLYGA